jgi:hypothetical protein
MERKHYMIKRTVLLLLVLALAVPAAAAAKAIDVGGPATITGHGPVRGKLRSVDGPARVTFHLSGKILVSGKAEDLEVSCEGARVKTSSKVNRRGLELVACMGRRMTVVVSATAFHFGAIAGRYLIEIPEGVNGTLFGRFRGNEERPSEEEQPAEPEAPAER